MSCESPASNLFPLPCSALETYLLVDDRASHPVVSFLEARLEGVADLIELEQAANEAIERHPLMNARIEGNGPTQWQWVASGQSLRFRSISCVDQLPRVGEEGMNLRTESGLVIWVLLEKDTTRLYLQVHHAVSDALGMLTFLFEWLVLYARRVGGEAAAPPLPPPNWDRLVDRENLTGLKSPHSKWRRWRRVLDVVFSTPVQPLPTLTESESQTVESPGHCRIAIDAEDVARLRDFAKSRPLSPLTPVYPLGASPPKTGARGEAMEGAQQTRATLGDLILLATFQAIHEWTLPERLATYRLVVPINRREDDERLLSAANKISYKYLSLTPAQLADANQALGTIATEMEFVRRHRLSIFNMLKALRTLTKWGLLRPLLYSRRCFGMVVMSNLGDINRTFVDLLPQENGEFRSGNLVLKTLALAPPRRPLTHTTLVSFSYAGRLNLVSRGDGRGLSLTQTQAFLELVARRLRTVTEAK